MTLTNKELDRWMKNMPQEKMREIVKQWDQLKQHLCARILLVPTGEDDWVQRSIDAAYKLKKNEEALRTLVYKTEIACAEARNSTRELTCTNCSGRGSHGEDPCSICRGTGRRHW